MLTALIGIDGLRERDVRRSIARNDGAALLRGDGGLQGLERVWLASPAVVHGLTVLPEKAVVGIEGGATTLTGAVGIHAHGGLRQEA